MPSLSVIITTKNAAASITSALSSANFAHETIVVDSGSTDQTRAICLRFGVKFISHSWSGYGPQKNFGASRATGDWLLFLDADEVITKALRTEIRAAITSQKHNIFWFRLVTVFLGKTLHHLYGHNPRLIRRGAANWNEAPVHEQLVRTKQSTPQTTIKLNDPDTGLIKEPIIHYSHSTVSSYLKKMHRYTTLDAQSMAATSRLRSGRPVNKSYLLPYHLALRQFIKLLLYRRGFLDGLPGITWCVLSSYYEYEMSKKYLKII